MDMIDKANKLASDKLHQIHLNRERELTEEVRKLTADKAAMAELIMRLLAPDDTSYEIIHGHYCPLV